MNRITKRFPDPPRGRDTDIEDIKQYLELLVREITEGQKGTISGPLNTTAFVPKTFTHTYTLDASSATLQNVRDCLCTLIQLLKDGGVLK